MTFREKLEKEHTDRCSPYIFGGCCACPITYGYEDKRPEELCKLGTKSACENCWDREIPETEEEKKPEVNNIPVDMAALGTFIREIAKDPSLYISIGIGHGMLNIGITHNSEED